MTVGKEVKLAKELKKFAHVHDNSDFYFTFAAIFTNQN